MGTTSLAPVIGRRLTHRRLNSQLLDLAAPIEGLSGVRWVGTGVKVERFPFNFLKGGEASVCGGSTYPTGYLECSENDWDTFDSFVVGEAIRRQVSGELAASEDADSLLRAMVDHGLSRFFAYELLNGTAAGGTHSFSADAHAPAGVAFGSAATPIWNAISVLEADLADTCGPAIGMIHLPPGLLGQAVSSYGLRWVDGHWETPLGHWVVADAGYLDAVAPSGEAAAAAGEDWVYASGLVSYAHADDQGPIGGLLSERSLTLSRNRLERALWSYGILAYDPSLVTAVLTSYQMES